MKGKFKLNNISYSLFINRYLLQILEFRFSQSFSYHSCKESRTKIKKWELKSLEFKVKGLGCSLPLMPDRDAVSMQPAWEQSMWLDREKGFNHFLALFL